MTAPSSDWSPEREETIFHAAQGIASPEERACYLKSACAGSSALEARIQQLLASEASADALLEFDLPPDAAKTGTEEYPGMVIDRYRLIREIGAGSMGTVFEAEQLLPYRKTVALKVIRAGLNSVDVARRFERERQVLAKLDHPNVAHVVDGGTTAAGRPYFVMELVRGKPITKYCDDERLRLEARLELFLLVCRGVQHAHQRGVIHRDLKPGNVLVTEVDGRGTPVVIDFGVAKAFHAEADPEARTTRSDEVLGNLAAMSPEQVAGVDARIDTRTDVYALGALLYELLAGTLPLPAIQHERGGWLAIARIIQEQVPTPPSVLAGVTVDERNGIASRRQVSTPQLRSALRNDLDWIVLKALEKEPESRFSTVGEMMASIQLYLAGFPARTSSVGWWHRSRKFVRRNRVLSAAASVVVVIGVVATVLIVKKSRETSAALVKADAAVAALEEQLVQGSRELLDAGRSDEGLELLADLVRRRPEDARLSTWLVNELSYRSFPKPVLPPIKHPDIVYSAQFSPDGRSLLTTCIDNAARVFDPTTGKLKFPPLQHDPKAVLRRVYDRGLHALTASFSPDGSLIATASCDRTTQVWDARSGEPLFPPLKHPRLVSFAMFAPDGRHLVTGCEDGTVRFWRLADGSLVDLAFNHEEWVNSAGFTGDGRYLITAGDDDYVRFWDVTSRSELGPVIKDADNFKLITISPNGRRIVAVGSTGRNRLLGHDSGSFRELGLLSHGGVTSVAAFSHDGRWIATGSFDQRVRVWAAEDGESKAQFKHAGTVRSVQFSPDGLHVLSASEDGTAVIWDIDSGKPVIEPMRHGDTIWSARFSPSGNHVATASSDGRVILWDARPSDSLPLMIPSDGAPVRQVNWSKDGEWIANVGVRGMVWSAVDGQPATGKRFPAMGTNTDAEFHPTESVMLTGSIEGHAEVRPVEGSEKPLVRVRHAKGTDILRSRVLVSWSSTGERFLTSGNGGDVRVWNFPAGTEVQPALKQKGAVAEAEYTPNGQFILTGLEDGTMTVWDAADHKQIASWKLSGPTAKAFDVSNDGKKVITCSDGNEAHVWELPLGKAFGRPIVMSGEVTDVALSFDGRLAVVAARNGIAQVWDVDRGMPLGVPMRHGGPIISIAISNDDQMVITTAEDSTARVWDLRSGRPLTPYLPHANRVRTAEFSPHGVRCLTGSDGMMHVWSIMRMNDRAPDWLPDLALSLIRDPGSVLDFAELASEESTTSSWDEWRQWFFADRLARPHAPHGALRTDELVDQWTAETDVAWDRFREPLLKLAVRLQPSNRLAAVRLEALKLARESTQASTGQPSQLPPIETEPSEDRFLRAWASALSLSGFGDAQAAFEEMSTHLGSECDEPMFWLLAAELGVGTGRSQLAMQCVIKAVEALRHSRASYYATLHQRWAIQLWALDLVNRQRVPNASEFVQVACEIPEGLSAPDKSVVQLDAHYNLPLAYPWQEAFYGTYDLRNLPSGLQKLGSTIFDVRGGVQLASSLETESLPANARSRAYLRAYLGPNFERSLNVGVPASLENLKVGRSIRQVQVLMTALETPREIDGPVDAVQIALNYADGTTASQSVRFGQHFRALFGTGQSTEPPIPAWVGTTHGLRDLRLYVVTLTNEHPERVVETLSIRSGMKATNPVIIAVSTD